MSGLKLCAFATVAVAIFFLIAGVSGQPPFVKDGATVSFFTLGHIPGPRFLDGRTANGLVGLAPSTGRRFSGTHWKARRLQDRSWAFYSLGKGGGNARWLSCSPDRGTVSLALSTNPPGTHWDFIRAGRKGGVWALKCRGNVPGPTFLNALTASGQVGLSPHYGWPYTGALWRVEKA